MKSNVKRGAAALVAVVALGAGFALATAGAAPEDSLNEAVAELVAANRISGQNNSYRRDNPNEYARVMTYLNGGERPAGSLTRMGEGLVAIEDARRELNEEPPPSTTAPPTTTAPPLPPACRVSNAPQWEPEDCAFGTLIERTNQAWECTQPIGNYGPLPIKVVIHSTQAWNSGWGAAAGNGCVGDGNPDTVDLLVFVEGNGARSSRGVMQDAFKTRGADSGPRDIQISGQVECGPTAAGAHQDHVQIQGGQNVTFVNFGSGDWDAGLATCPGAGGVIYTNPGQNIDFVRSFFVGCNHGFTLNGSLPNHDVIDSGMRTSRTDGSDPNCPNSGGGSRPCPAGLAYANTICQRWDAAADVWRND